MLKGSSTYRIYHKPLVVGNCPLPVISSHWVDNGDVQVSTESQSDTALRLAVKAVVWKIPGMRLIENSQPTKTAGKR